MEPLSPAAVTELTRSGGGDLDPEALYRTTNGNPFFVTEALASPGAGVPDTVRDAVFARAARLDPRARELVDAVSIASPHAEFWLLEALAPDSVGSLEACLASGIIQADAGRVSFRHELARIAVGGLASTRHPPCAPRLRLGGARRPA